MAAEPVRELIVQDCVTSLLAINGTGDYWSILLDAVRGKLDPESPPLTPFIDEGDEQTAPGNNPQVSHVLPITVEVVIQSADGDLPTLVNRLIADLERALTGSETSRSRGGRATTTTLTGNSRTLDPPPGVLASIRVQFEITYLTRLGQPELVG